MQRVRLAEETPGALPRSINVPQSGTWQRSSSSQGSASESAGARQSPRGLSEPPEPTFGPFGRHERLNWLSLKKRNRNTSIHFLIVATSYCRCFSIGKSSGHLPRILSDQAC